MKKLILFLFSITILSHFSFGQFLDKEKWGVDYLIGIDPCMVSTSENNTTNSEIYIYTLSGINSYRFGTNINYYFSENFTISTGLRLSVLQYEYIFASQLSIPCACGSSIANDIHFEIPLKSRYHFGTIKKMNFFIEGGFAYQHYLGTLESKEYLHHPYKKDFWVSAFSIGLELKNKYPIFIQTISKQQLSTFSNLSNNRFKFFGLETGIRF